MPTRQNMPFVPLRKPFFLCLRRSGGLSQEEPVEPVSGFEPLTVRLQGGCSAKLSYTGRLVRTASDAEPLPGYRFGGVSANRLPPPPQHQTRSGVARAAVECNSTAARAASTRYL